MELRQLRYFAAVAEELHFARAAEHLHIAQQSLSFQIKQLEEELGTALFERTTRRVELTTAGHAFLKEVTAAFDHLAQGVDKAQRAGRGEIGRLVVGYHSTALYNVMPVTVRMFRDRYPEVEIVLQEMTMRALHDGLLSGTVDVGLAGLMETVSDDLASAVLYCDQVAVALPHGHRLSDCTGIPLASISHEPFVMYSRLQKPDAYDQIIALCRGSGFSPRIAQEAASESAILSLVAAGVGVAIVVNSLRHVRADEVSYVPIIEPTIDVNFGLLWRRDSQSPIVRAFIQTAQEAKRDG